MGLIHGQTLKIVLPALGAGIIATIANLYYIKIFFDEFHLSSGHLKIVQMLFLVWNAVNDPLLGYVQDLGLCGMTWMMNRGKVVFYAGPAFCLTFLMFWFPWSTSVSWITAVHLMVSLFIYDTLLTLVFSAYCGLCVESSQKHSDRVRIIVYGEIFTILLGSIIFPLETMPHSGPDYVNFQIYVTVITVFAAALLLFSGYSLKDLKPAQDDVQLHKFEEPDTKKDKSQLKHAMKVSWQIVKEPRFICLVGAQFFRIIRFMSNENFLIVYVETFLINQGMFEKNSSNVGLYYLLVRAAGSALFLLLWFPTNKFGTQFVIQMLNIASLINIGLAFYFGYHDNLAVFIFILVENAICRCGWQGFYIVVAGEVVDTDFVENKRKSPYSTIIFTLKALFTKPADQLAPVILLILFMENGGYPELTSTCNQISESVLNGTMVDAIESTDLTVKCNNYSSWMFAAMIFFPAICAIGESFFVGVDQIVKRRKHAKSKAIGDDLAFE